MSINSFITKIRLSDSKVYQNNDDTLTLSGDTVISPSGGFYFDEQDVQNLVNDSYVRRDNTGKLIISNNKPGYFVGLNQESLPLYTFNSPDIVIDSSSYIIYDNFNNTGEAKDYVIPQNTLSLTLNNTLYYIVVDYNSGNPLYDIITDKSLINNSSIVLVFSVFRVGTVLHITPWLTGRGLANNTEKSIIKGFKFIRVDGLEFEVIPNRIPKIYQGTVVYGANNLILQEAQAQQANVNLYECVYNGTGWNITPVSQIQNTSYQGPTGKLILTENNYSVAWIYRGVSDTTIKNIYYVLGSGDNNIVEANNDKPVVPDIISENAIIISRVIIKKGFDIPERVDWYYDEILGVTAHENLIGLDRDNAHQAPSIGVSDIEFTDIGVESNVLDVLKQTRQNITRYVTQVGHGFVVGDVVGLNNIGSGTLYYKVSATNIEQVKPVGIISRVINDTNSFVITQQGYITGLPSGLTLLQNSVYYIGEIAGKLRLLDTTKANNFPILITRSTTSGWILPSLGITKTPFADQNNIIYFSKTGSDSNKGLKINEPVQTITQALTSSINPPFAVYDKVSIVCLDSAEYNENIDVYDNKHVYAPNATIKGSIVLREDSSVVVDKHISDSDSTVLLDKQGEGFASYQSRITDSTAHNTVICIRNIANDSILFAQVDDMKVGQSGIAVTDITGGSYCFMQLNIKSILLQGNNSYGINLTNLSDCSGYVNDIVKSATATGTTAINVGGVSVIDIKLTINNIDCDTAWVINNNNSSVWLNCLDVSGTKTLTSGDVIINAVKAHRVIQGDNTTNTFTISNPFPGTQTLNTDLLLIDGVDLIPVDVSWKHDTSSDNIVIEFDYDIPSTEIFNVIITR